jgi:steroid delta-isomerase-like uncharacterized protein
MSALNNKDLVLRFYEEVINNRKLYLLDQFAAADFKDHNPEPGQEPGLDGVKKMFAGWVEAIPDFRLEPELVVAEGDLVCARVRMTGTHRGPFNGIPATGRTLDTAGFDWIRIKDGKVAERWGVFDTVGMLSQLGAVPGPTSSDLKATSAKYFDKLDSSKGDAAVLRKEFLHPQVRIEFGGQPMPCTVDNFGALLQGFWAAFPDIKHELRSQIGEGGSVMNHFNITGTHKGEFAGVAATNKTVKTEGMALHRYADGKIVEIKVELDMIQILQQIGAMPTE